MKTRFKTLKKGTYCLACVEFGRFFVDDEIEIKQWATASTLFGDYELSFSLTEGQQECAQELVRLVNEQQDVLIYACCGAGKTELIFPLITYCFQRKLKVGIAIPRSDVVIELEKRISAAFPKKRICAVYGGHHEEIDGDIILCTTHQLHRYAKAFDVLILDEVDAFPFKGNKVLAHIAQDACRGNFVYLSATPDGVMKQRVKQGTLKQIVLFRRPHGHPLCVPKIKLGFLWMLYYELFVFLKRHQKKTVLLFVPSITIANQWYSLLSKWSSVCVFTSKSENRSQRMEEIRARKYQIVICTTVLERGITIADVQVVVWRADHVIFDEATLIQILGRVGRSKEAYEGEGVLLCLRKSSSISSCINSLKKMNAA